MPLDGVMLHALRDDLCDHAGARLDRITQPERDEVILHFYTKGKNRRLLLSANSAASRVQWIGYPKENPAFAPNFCMLLRKHLVGARLEEVIQPGLERVLILRFSCKNDFYENVEKRLVVELIGRAANFILTDGEGKIFDSLRQFDLTAGSRRLLPGVRYELPPSPGKQVLLENAELPPCDAPQRADRFLTDHFEGFSPLLSRELIFRALGDCDAPFPSDADGKARITEELKILQDALLQRRYRPVVLRCQTPKDFYCFSLRQYDGAMEQEVFSDLSAAMDVYYSEKDAADHLRRHSADIAKVLSGTVSRLTRKMEAQRRELAESDKADLYKKYGDMIVSSLYLFHGRESSAVLTDYSCDPPVPVTVPLDPSLSASRNAQVYYKKYKKAQMAKIMLRQQIDRALAEVDYLNSVEDALKRASGLAEINDLRRELAEQGYLHKQQSREKRQPKYREQSKPLEYCTEDGFRILCGRNNLQNDALTLHTAEKRDIWFHVKNHPGSHVILFTEGRTPSDQAMTDAAVIAATNSSVGDSDHAEVDYTEVRYVRKPAGAKPGMVVYDPYRTAYVKLDPERCSRLKK